LLFLKVFLSGVQIEVQTFSKRRAKGEGSVYQRKDGKWCAELNGQYKYSTTEEGAKAKLYQMLAGVEESKPQNITVATLMDRWFEYQEPNLKPSTIKRYGEAIQIYVNPNLGHRKLHALTAFQVQSLYSKMLRDGLSATTVNLVHSVLSSAFKRAIKRRMVEHNVISHADAPRIQRKEGEVFSPSEVMALLSAASQDRYRGVYEIALSTGMRGGAILALQPQAVKLVYGSNQLHLTSPSNFKVCSLSRRQGCTRHALWIVTEPCTISSVAAAVMWM